LDFVDADGDQLTTDSLRVAFLHGKQHSLAATFICDPKNNLRYSSSDPMSTGRAAAPWSPT
jgi:alkyl hydroperoxide reductase subunit AhpC